MSFASVPTRHTIFLGGEWLHGQRVTRVCCRRKTAKLMKWLSWCGCLVGSEAVSPDTIVENLVLGVDCDVKIDV